MIFDQNFIEFIVLCNRFGVRYLVVGGYAVGVHGYPRNTGDMDIWIEKSEANADKMMRVIEEFGFASLGLTREDFLTKDYITQLGYPPLRIDILNDLAEIDFGEAEKSKRVVMQGDISIDFIGLHELIRAKEVANRKQDIADVEKLKKINKLK